MMASELDISYSRPRHVMSVEKNVRLVFHKYDKQKLRLPSIPVSNNTHTCQSSGDTYDMGAKTPEVIRHNLVPTTKHQLTMNRRFEQYPTDHRLSYVASTNLTGVPQLLSNTAKTSNQQSSTLQFKLPRLRLRHIRQPSRTAIWQGGAVTSSQLIPTYLQNSTRQIPYATLVGHSVHRECHPNSQNQRELPCILDPTLIETEKHTESPTDYFKPAFNQSDSKVNNSGVIHLSYSVGEFAYLPCRTLGAGQTE
ncbi:hypothetical protein X801_06216, partial [Opisthorchis viverrini]